MLSATDFSTARLTTALVRRRSVYSTRALCAAAFLGGVSGVVLLSALNSWRIGRPWRDLPFHGAWLALWGLWMLYLHHHYGPSAARQIAVVMLSTRSFAGLVCFAALARLHRRFHRAQQVMGRAAPDAGGPAGLAVVASVALDIALC